MPFYDQMLRYASQTYSSALRSVVGNSGSTLSEASLSLLDRVLVADPSMRASAKVALNSKYFMLHPQAPRDPTELEPLNLGSGVNMHEYETKLRRREKEKEKDKEGPDRDGGMASAPMLPRNPYGGPPVGAAAYPPPPPLGIVQGQSQVGQSFPSNAPPPQLAGYAPPVSSEVTGSSASMGHGGVVKDSGKHLASGGRYGGNSSGFNPHQSGYGGAGYYNRKAGIAKQHSDSSNYSGRRGGGYKRGRGTDY